MKVKIKIPFGQCSNWGMYQYLLPMKILILQEVMVDENMEEVEFNKKILIYVSALTAQWKLKVTVLR